MTWLHLWLVAAVLISGQCSAECVKDYQPKSADEIEVVRVENDWCDAAIKRDSSRLDTIFADDITWIEDVGYRNKAEVLHRYLVEVQERMIELRDIRMRMEGDLAIVSSHIHVVKTVAGKTTDSTHTSTDVFRKHNGKWQLIVE
jgi:ketosteroid isomerase-like protein